MEVPNDFTEDGLNMEPHKEVSVLIGGRAGDGISSAGLLVAHLLGKLGYRIYMYFDYPSLVKGGHNFAIVRASGRPIGAVRDCKARFSLSPGDLRPTLPTAKRQMQSRTTVAGERA